MRSARGQGTVEYLAVVLLVALVFAGTATAATDAGRHIATEVPHEIVRALCIVRDGDCYRDVAPCDVGSRTTSTRFGGRFRFLKGGHYEALIREARSDGKVAVTRIIVRNVGAQTTRGARLRLMLGNRSVTLGSQMTAEVLASIGHGRSWIVDGAPEADALVAALDAGAATADADQELREGTLEAGAELSAMRGAQVSGALSASLKGGWLTDRTGGNRTFFFEPGLSADVAVSVGEAAISADAGGGDRFALTVARDGRWLDLAITRAGEVGASVKLPSQLASIAGALDIPDGVGGRWVTDTHLDLTEAGNLAAARAFVSALERPNRWDTLPGAVRRLSRRVAEKGVVDVRAYATERSARGFDLQLGEWLGGTYEDVKETTRLLAAATRGMDGVWRDREDCREIRT
jgi:hypothetical protein